MPYQTISPATGRGGPHPPLIFPMASLMQRSGEPTAPARRIGGIVPITARARIIAAAAEMLRGAGGGGRQLSDARDGQAHRRGPRRGFVVRGHPRLLRRKGRAPPGPGAADCGKPPGKHGGDSSAPGSLSVWSPGTSHGYLSSPGGGRPAAMVGNVVMIKHAGNVPQSAPCLLPACSRRCPARRLCQHLRQHRADRAPDR